MGDMQIQIPIKRGGHDFLLKIFKIFFQLLSILFSYGISKYELWV